MQTKLVKWEYLDFLGTLTSAQTRLPVLIKGLDKLFTFLLDGTFPSYCLQTSSIRHTLTSHFLLLRWCRFIFHLRNFLWWKKIGYANQTVCTEKEENQLGLWSWVSDWDLIQSRKTFLWQGNGRFQVFHIFLLFLSLFVSPVPLWSLNTQSSPLTIGN